MTQNYWELYCITIGVSPFSSSHRVIPGWHLPSIELSFFKPTEEFFFSWKWKDYLLYLRDGPGIRKVFSLGYCKRGHKVWHRWKPMAKCRRQGFYFSTSMSSMWSFVLHHWSYCALALINPCRNDNKRILLKHNVALLMNVCIQPCDICKSLTQL